MFCGNSCATVYDTGASWGLGLSFHEPFIDDRADFKLDEVETSQGKIYLKMRITRGDYHGGEHYGKDARRSVRRVGPAGIEHYTCNEIANHFPTCHAKVGMCLEIRTTPYLEKHIAIYKERLADPKLHYDHPFYRNQIQYYEAYIQTAKTLEEKIEKNLEGILLYKSIPFYNLVHSERDYPSCTLYIYDKEMKNAIPSGV